MNEQQKKIKTSSKVISVIMKIGYIAMIVEMAISLSCLIFIAVTGKTSITVGDMTIIAAEADGVSVTGVGAMCVTAIIMGAFLFTVFYLAYRIFREINETCNPFNTKYVGIIKVIGILVAIMPVVGSLVDSIAASFAGMETLGMYDDMTGSLFGVIIFCIAYIFDYGCALQKQSDETL